MKNCEFEELVGVLKGHRIHMNLKGKFYVMGFPKEQTFNNYIHVLGTCTIN